MACLALLAGGGAERAGGLARAGPRTSTAADSGCGSSRPDFGVPRVDTALLRVGVVSSGCVSRGRSCNPTELHGVGHGAVGSECRVLWVAGRHDIRVSPVRSVRSVRNIRAQRTRGVVAGLAMAGGAGSMVGRWFVISRSAVRVRSPAPVESITYGDPGFKPIQPVSPLCHHQFDDGSASPHPRREGRPTQVDSPRTRPEASRHHRRTGAEPTGEVPPV